MGRPRQEDWEFKISLGPGMEAYTFDPSNKRQVSEHEFKVSHGYIVRTCLKN